MAFNTTAASNTPDLKRLPISALHPGLPSLATQSIVAIVTLVWPYSSSTGSCALLLAEPDFRLRRRRGQVRVQFFADAAHAVATSGVGIGDVVVLRLGPAVQWLSSSGEEEVVRTPGKSVEWELGYRRALRLRAWRDGEPLASLDVRGEETPERQIEEAEEEVYSTPSKIVGRFSGEGLKMGSWASPAFLKRSRLSLDSVRQINDLFPAEDGYLEGKGRKKRKSWMDVGKWTYANRTPSPEKGDASSAEDRSPSQVDGVAMHPADIINTPDSSKTSIEVDENDELVPERPASNGEEDSTILEAPNRAWSDIFSRPKPAAAAPLPEPAVDQKPALDDVDIASPRAALPEIAILSRQEAIDQQYLTEIHQSAFVGGDAEETVEVDELHSEPEDRMEGQLSFKELKALEQAESSTEEDEPPLLVDGALRRSEPIVSSGSGEEDSDDGLLEVTELDRSLTPTEVDSEEEEESESEEEDDTERQAAHGPVESVPVEETTKTAPQEPLAEASRRDEKMSSFEAVFQPGTNQAMPPPPVRPMGIDDPATSTATRTPPRTPTSFAVGSEQAPPTPQLPPVSSKNLPLPSPFPGSSTREPTSYMDAGPLPEGQGPAELKRPAPHELQQLPIVEEEQDSTDLQVHDSVASSIPPIDPGLHQTQGPADGGLSDVREFPEPTEPFPFGLDGAVFSRMGKSQALDPRVEESPAVSVSETEKQEGAPTAVAPASASMDVVMQDEHQGEYHQSQQDIASIAGTDVLLKQASPAVLPSLGNQPVDFGDLTSLPRDSATRAHEAALLRHDGPIFQGPADDYQPPSLSFDDGYVPMVDDWEMPNMDSDPVEKPVAPYGQDSFAPPREDTRERPPIPHDMITSPIPNENIVAEKPPVGTPPKSSKSEVTIIDLENDTEEDGSDDEAVATTTPSPHTVVAPASPSDYKTISQPALETPIKLAIPETAPQKSSSQMLSPVKRSQQRGKTPFSDLDDMSQVGSTPRGPRPIGTSTSQESIADCVSNRRRRTGVKDSECELDSTATISSQKPSSPPSEADLKLLEDNERYSTSTTRHVPEQLSQQPVQVPAQKSSPQPVEEARRLHWENERYSSPLTSQLLEDLSPTPIEELSQRRPQLDVRSEQSPKKPSVTTIESLALPEAEQSVRAPSEVSEKAPKSTHGKIQISSPIAQSPRAHSEISQYAGTSSSPAPGSFRDMVRAFVRSSSPLPEHTQPSPTKQPAHSSMLIDDPSMMRTLQTPQAPFSALSENRMTPSPPREDTVPTLDSTQAKDDETQEKAPSPVRSPSVVASTVRPVVDRSSPMVLEATNAAPSVENQHIDENFQMEDSLALPTKPQGLPEIIAETAASIQSAHRPAQESLLTPDPSQQIAYMPSSFQATHMDQVLPPTAQQTQFSQMAEELDLTQVKAKTQDLKIMEPTSPHEERADTTMDDTTLVEPPATGSQALYRAELASPSFSVRSIEETKSPSPTFSERVRLHESSQLHMSQRSNFSQSQGIRTSLSYFTSLSSLSQHLNSQAKIDILAVCTRATKRPERATSGPKDYFTSFRIAEQSLDVVDDSSPPSTVQVQVFRPWKAALPECDVGDVVLLRNFVPKSRKGKVGLISAAESAWCVFRYGKNLSQRAGMGQSRAQTNGDMDGENVELQYDDNTEKGEAKDDKKSKRRSNIVDSLRPIWAVSGLWGDLTGLVESMDNDDDDAAAANNNTEIKAANDTDGEKGKDQVSTDLEHGRYNHESGASREECHGPPVEYGDQERREARRLRKWWVGAAGGASE